jgi:hypothetical protein
MEFQMTALFHLEAQYDAFLFASLCEDDEVTLRVLSVLARQDLDPWQEAGRLAQLSKAEAINSFASRIWKSDSERWSPSEASVLAVRLIELLPSHGSSPSNSPAAEQPSSGMMMAWLVIGALMGSTALSGNSIQNSATGTRDSHGVSMVVQKEALPPSSNEVGTD